MREYIFRGKRVDAPHEWLYGDLNIIDGKVYIFQRTEDTPLNSPDWFEVIPETVGQYTGLKDKNGKMIFEGDVLDASEKIAMIFEVYYQDGGFRYGTKDRSTDIPFSGHNWLANILSRFHVIGNIHDNPELLNK